jgi:hypothetical protein
MNATRFDRWYAGPLRAKLTRPYVQLRFGARQAGKSTLIRGLLPPDTLVVDLADPKERTRHLADPGAFLGVCRELPADREGQFVFVDQAQAVPTIFDAVQHLYDGNKIKADWSHLNPGGTGWTRRCHLVSCSLDCPD